MRRIEKGLLAAAVAAGLAVSAGSASAQSWYLKGFGGATWPSGQEENLKLGNTNSGSRLKFDYDTGYTLGAAVGYDVTPNVAIEGEYAYRNASVSTDLRSSGTSTSLPSNDGTSNSIMFNALYKFNGMGANGAFRPYLGAGIGGANVSIDANNASWDSGTLFAYQLIAGVGYTVTPQWTLFGETRWFATQGGTFDGPGNANFDFAVRDLRLPSRRELQLLTAPSGRPEGGRSGLAPSGGGVGLARLPRRAHARHRRTLPQRNFREACARAAPIA